MSNSGFNPQSRWDRHIPGSESPDPQSLNEKIEVLAVFKGGKVYPKKFIWNNKAYAVKKINYNWQERCGQEVISCFSISTDPDVYQISFNNTSLAWKMDKIIT
jgi:hypothetical protein